MGAILLGGLTVPDYGYSWDEYANAFYGEATLDQYVQDGVFMRVDRGRFEKPPFYFMVFNVSRNVLRTLFPSWLATDARHFTNHAAFLLGMVFFYLLSRRFMPTWAAVGATLLFATQPLYYGHSFINQKDIPFMSAFLASVYLGFRAVDSLKNMGTSPSTKPDNGVGNTSFAELWRAIKLDYRRFRPIVAVLILILILLVGLLLMELFREQWILPILQGVLRQAFHGDAPSAITGLFRAVAQDQYKTPLEAYSQKLQVAYRWARLVIVPMALIGLIGFFYSLLRNAVEVVGRERFKTLGILLMAAGVLGLASSTREGGPFAGLLVSGYMVYKIRQRALVPILIYATVAFSVMYLTWPVLWGNPLSRLLARFSTVTHFPQHVVLYGGIHHSSHELPWHYLPNLILIQHTLPALLAMLIGVGAYGLHKWEIPRGRGVELLICVGWFAIPFLSVVILGTPIYGNFRHVFFSIPPLFILAGIGLGSVLARVSSSPLRWFLVFACSIPGIVAIVQNYPYQYVYYNEIAGGISGADGAFELDYWCVSYREAMDFVNTNAPQGARVAVDGPVASAAAFARDDLEVRLARGALGEVDMALACKNSINREKYYPELDVVHQVTREGAVLSEVKTRDR